MYTRNERREDLDEAEDDVENRSVISRKEKEAVNDRERDRERDISRRVRASHGEKRHARFRLKLLQL